MTLCKRCQDTGHGNHEEITAYWGAVNDILDEGRVTGYVVRRRLGPEPEPVECEECPKCAVCFARVAEHTDRQIVECMRDFYHYGEAVLHEKHGKDPRWVLPEEVKG